MGYKFVNRKIILYYYIMVNTKRVKRSSDGMYHVNGKKFPHLVGRRAQVWHGTAYKTNGGLTKKHLLKNQRGNIVSKKKHMTEKKNKRLAKLGFKPKKGHFVLFKKKSKTQKKR